MNKTILVIILIILIGIGAYSIGKKDSKDIVVNTTDQQPSTTQKQTSDNKQSNLTSEESSTETFKNQPGEVKSITVKANNQWQLAVDLLSHNPKWIPGDDSTGGFFINQNPKLRTLAVTSATKTYECGAGSDGNDTTPDVQVSTSNYIQMLQSDNYKNRYFDINGSTITAIYEQCLP